MTNITEKEAITLNYMWAAGGSTTLPDIAEGTELSINSVRMIVRSLVNKKLVEADASEEETAIQFLRLTPAGVEAIDGFVKGAEEADEGVEDQADGDEDAPEPADAEAAFMEALRKAGADEETAKAMGHPFPGIICATLREFAGGWEGPRKSFLATAQSAGFNRATAQTQWQRARGKKAEA